MMIGLTGAGGVLGRRLYDAFSERGRNVKPFIGDIRDIELVMNWAEGCTNIVHAAAIVPTNLVKSALDAAIAVNVAGTANIATAAAEIGVDMTYISTSHVYKSSCQPLSEDAPISPVSLYGLTKWQGEQWVDRLVDAPLILRIFSYFDSRQAATFLVPALHKRISEASENIELPLFGYSSSRDIADARWLAECLAELVIRGAKGVLNVGTGEGSSIAEIAGILAASAGRDDVCWAPANAAQSDALVADISAMQNIIAIPPFNLSAALKSFVVEVE